jgi:rod shape-determining protein MreD
MRRLILLRLKLLSHQAYPLLILLVLSFMERSHVLRVLPVEPLLVLPLIYYWSLFRMEKLSTFSLFVLGIFDDVLSGAYLGQTSLLLLILYALVLTQRHHIKDLPFKFIWGIFGIFMICATILEWGIASLLTGRVLSSIPLMGQNILAVILYPWFNKIITKIEK